MKVFVWPAIKGALIAVFATLVLGYQITDYQWWITVVTLNVVGTHF